MSHSNQERPRTGGPVRVAVVEDQPLYRNMLCGLLRARDEVEVVVEAGGVREARDAIQPGQIDVAILDVDLADGNGIALGVQLRRRDPRVGILLLSSLDVMDLLLDLPDDVRTGWSYLSKHSPLSSVESIVSTLQATARGETVLDPTLVARARPRRGSALASLSERQYEVLQHVAQGHSNAGVGERLGISARSVENHLNAIYAALELPTDRNARVSAVLRLIEESSRV